VFTSLRFTILSNYLEIKLLIQGSAKYSEIFTPLPIVSGTGYCFRSISLFLCLFFVCLFLCQQDYEKTAGPICMKFSGKVWSDHGTTFLVNSEKPRDAAMCNTGAEFVVLSRHSLFIPCISHTHAECNILRYHATKQLIKKLSVQHDRPSLLWLRLIVSETVGLIEQ